MLDELMEPYNISVRQLFENLELASHLIVLTASYVRTNTHRSLLLQDLDGELLPCILASSENDFTLLAGAKHFQYDILINLFVSPTFPAFTI